MANPEKNMVHEPPTILILADFSDGRWHAISFAMQYLYTPGSPVTILQTFQKPNFGQAMLHNIVPRLKEIIEHEFKDLKYRLLKNFSIDPGQVSLLSLNGELVNLLKYKLDANTTYNIVIGTYSSFADSCTMQNMCMAKLINCVSSPLFILPQFFEKKESNQLLFVPNPYKVPTQHTTNQVLDICRKLNPELDILFVVEKDSIKIDEGFSAFIETHFKGIKHKVSYIRNSSVCKGMKNYLKNNCKDLIIVERNQPESMECK